MARDQYAADPEVGCKRGRMDRSGPAKCHQRESPRIETAADGHKSDTLDHLRVHDAMDT